MSEPNTAVNVTFPSNTAAVPPPFLEPPVCQWQIQAPEGYRVYARLLELNLPPFLVSFGYLESPQHVRALGPPLQLDIVSPSNVLIVSMDFPIPDDFTLEFTATDETGMS